MKRWLAPAVVILFAATALSAQAPAPAQAPASGAVPRVDVTAGRSTIITTDFDIERIAVTNPAIADATVVSPREVLVDGKANGTVSLIVWGGGTRRQYDISVTPAVSLLQQTLQQLFPGEDIHVSATDEAIVLSGHVSSNPIMLRAGEIAQASSSKAKVINLLQLPGGTETEQVMLQVRFAEVTRSKSMELGVNLFTGLTGYKDFIARSTTQQFAAPNFNGIQGSGDRGLTFSDFLNLFVFNTKYDVGAVIKALETRGLLQSLAEPNLIAYNGQEASFLAGGEIPIPVVQGAGVGVGSVTVQFKEFGIRLSFTPTIAGDTIRLTVKPEVSALDFTNAVTLSGFKIPALTTRRAETTVELRDGQSFAIAGLLNNVAQDEIDAVPGLSKLPIIGYLFKSKSTTATRNELMVLITPRLVRPLNPDEVPPLPTLPKSFLPPEEGVGAALQGPAGIVDAPPATKKDPEKPVARN